MYVRVFERFGQAQDLHNQVRRFEELQSHFRTTQAERQKLFHGLSGAVLPQGVFIRAGLTTARTADKNTPLLIQTALEQSLVLRPFIATKLGKIAISKNYYHYGSDAEFDHTYLQLNKIVVPFGSKAEKDLLKIRRYYHRPTDSIHLRPSSNLGQALQMAIVKISSPGFRPFFGAFLDEGVGLYFTNLVLAEQGLQRMRSVDGEDYLDCATDLVGVVGQSMVGQAYFQNHADLIGHLTTKLSIGPVRTEELARDALCRTPLLRTARFASHQVKNMVAVGIAGPRWVRLWMRTDVPGIHEVHIRKIAGSRGSMSTKIMVPAGQPGDQTIAVTYPRSSEHPPLDPLAKYRYRIVRTSDGTPLGEGSFETSPAHDGDTPQKVVIAVISCHQPFTNQGTIAPESARMLRLIPRILRENDVKFVLACGDQIYADAPGVFSLFNNRYLIWHAVPGKTNLFDCSADEVRRVYDMRYRMFWSMNPLRKMYANYPCYPAMDDHEIRGDWGSLPEHSGPLYRNILRGALGAYFDYQASSVLPPMPQVPNSFHYHFGYGNIGVFVMDIRSQRLVNSRSQLYGDVQLNDFRRFLRDNGHKKVLLIVSSVPIVHLARLLTDAGVKLINPVLDLFGMDIDFPDHWSFHKNIPARNSFLSVLHEHQQTNPTQRVAIVSGDVHIGNAFSINWQGGNKPRLYQLTSSPISALFRGFEADVTTLGPRLLSSIDCPRTPFGGPCSGQVSLLQAANGASSRNPLVGLNLGLIEVHRFGDVSNLKFKLIGYHPTQERPVTYFESGYLG
jgi:alkaline phosphatase D